MDQTKDRLIKDLLFLLYLNSDTDPNLLSARYEDGYYDRMTIEELQQRISTIQESAFQNVLHYL